MILTDDEIEGLVDANQLSEHAMEFSNQAVDLLQHALTKERDVRRVIEKLYEEKKQENEKLKLKSEGQQQTISELVTVNKELKTENETQQIALDLHANFKSVLRYCDERGLQKSVKERIALGKVLSKISRDNGLEIHKVRSDDSSGRYETVNCYVPRAFELFEAQNLSLF